jgi:hypothetical protein
MSDNSANSATALEHVFDLIEDELLHASGEELDEMLRAWGIDSSRASEVVATAFKGALRMNNRNRLRDARKQAEVEIDRLRATAGDAAGTREELIARITTLLAARNAANPKGVTLGHRNLNEYTDEDLRSLLIQLSTLR